LSQIILIITLIKNIYSNINFIKKDDFIILSTLICSVFILIAHQLLTMNTIYIFSVIPIMSGLSHIFYLKYFNHKKTMEYIILFFTFIFSAYYFITYVDSRRFVVDKKYYDHNKIIQGSVLSEQLKNLEWITHYNQSPIDEVNQLIKNIDIIKKDQKKDKKLKKIVVTDYQFIFSLFSITNIPINKDYHPGVSYPLANSQYFNLYKEYFLKKLRKNKVEKIYILKPMWFGIGPEFFMDIIKENCAKKIDYTHESLSVYNIKNCY